MHYPIRVLFLCDGSAYRSKIAEGLLRTMGGEDFDVHSAGLEPEEPNPLAVKIMKEINIDISGQRINHINDYEGTQFDYIITLCDQVKDSCLAFPSDIENIHWSCVDPAEFRGTDEERLLAFRQVRDDIQSQLKSWLPHARKHAAGNNLV